MLLAQLLAHLVGRGHAAEAGTHDDDVGHGCSPSLISVGLAEPDRLADQLVHAADHVHVEAVVRQHLAELRLADGADGGHEIDAVLVDDVLQRFHARQRALDAQLDQVVGQEAAAATAAEGGLVDGAGRHVVEVVGHRLDDFARNDELAARHRPMREARATLHESWKVMMRSSFFSLSNLIAPCWIRS